jgi:hypothetical protein
LIVDYLAFLLSTCGQNGVVLDTNVFLLYVVGTLDPELLPRVKRTAIFGLDDWKLLCNLLSIVPKMIITPGIITEACNLLDSDNVRHDYRFFSILRHLAAILHEDYIRTETLSQHKLFFRFGLTDSSIAHLAGRGHLIITADLPLAVALEQLSLPVLNFNNLRAIDWIK